MFRFFYRLSHGTCLSCKDKPLLPSQKSDMTYAAGMGGNGFSVGRLLRYKGQTHTSLGGALQNLEEFLFPSVGRRLQSFQLSSVQFYAMCEGIMNFPAYCHLWPVYLYHIFPHYLINGMIFKKRY